MSDDTAYRLAAADVFSGSNAPADVQPLGALLLGEFAQAKADRELTEERWLKDLRQYKGQYEPNEELKMAGRSRAFVRKTRVKVKTVDARVSDLLFPSGSEQNFSIQSTPVPTLSDRQKAQVKERLGKLEQEGGQIDRFTVEKVVKEVANEAAHRMQSVINDQLTEARYRQACIRAIHSCHLYGTGIVKGPMVERRARTAFVRGKGGKYEPKQEYYYAPSVAFVPLWTFYPDMSAVELEHCRYAWELHHMTAFDLSELACRPSFDKQRIQDYIKAHPQGQVTPSMVNGELKLMGERANSADSATGQYEVLERWGWLTGEQLCQVGCKVDEERRHESFFSVVWLLPNGEVIKAALQPIDGTTWPYHLYHFDKDETSIFGEGLAGVMRDDQEMINAATRMLLDNGALASGPMFEVNPHLLSASEAASLTDIHAWRVWLRNSDNPGQSAVRPIGIDGRLGDLQSIKQMFEANADETTAIPRYMSGENATAGAAGTASGMSMLMGAANIVIKDLIAAWDEGVTRPFIEAMYRWNMKFHRDDSIKGDYAVAARGTSSLVAKEVRARQLNEFAQMTANPLDAPFIKRDVLNRLRAEANEMTDVVKTADEVKAEMAAQQNQQAQQMQQQMQQAQLQEAMGRAAEATAKAELTAAKAKEALANIELIVAKTVDARVEAIYASVQAGGAAAQSPLTAPVADEVLRSAGFKDANPGVEIADLMTPEVQGNPPQVNGGMNPLTGSAGMKRGINTVQV